MIFDTLDHLSRYSGLDANLDKAIEYLSRCDLAALPLGRTDIDGDEVFVNVMEADLHPDEGFWPEYHRVYADLQIDITGAEGWGCTAATDVPEVGEFTGDIGFKAAPCEVRGALGGGRFVIFFPTEPHKPGLINGGCAHVRKAVVKIKMEAK